MLPVQHRSLEWIPGAGSIDMVPVDRSESVWEPVVTGGPKSGRSQLPCAVRMQRVLHLSVCPAPFRWPVRIPGAGSVGRTMLASSEQAVKACEAGEPKIPYRSARVAVVEAARGIGRLFSSNSSNLTTPFGSKGDHVLVDLP